AAAKLARGDAAGNHGNGTGAAAGSSAGCGGACVANSGPAAAQPLFPRWPDAGDHRGAPWRPRVHHQPAFGADAGAAAETDATRTRTRRAAAGGRGGGHAERSALAAPRRARGAAAEARLVTMRNDRHPDANQLAACIEGRLEPRAARALRRHLGRCAACREWAGCTGALCLRSGLAEVPTAAHRTGLAIWMGA